MTPEYIYEHGGGSDIGQHLPTLRAAAHGIVVEIGTRGGVSTSALILGVREHGGHVYSIDIDLSCSIIFDPLPEWTFILGHSIDDRDRIISFLPSEIDVLFIDAEHDYHSVRQDLEAYGYLVKTGGLILLHDADPEEMGTSGGVLRAMTEYCYDHQKTMTVDSGSWGLGRISV